MHRSNIGLREVMLNQELTQEITKRARITLAELKRLANPIEVTLDAQFAINFLLKRTSELEDNLRNTYTVLEEIKRHNRILNSDVKNLEMEIKILEQDYNDSK